MNTKFSKLLSLGLQKEFKGELKGVFQDYMGLNWSVVDYETDNSGKYHDEYTGKRLVSGREIVSINQQSYIRQYAGGTVDSKTLSALKLNDGDVIGFLVKVISNNAEKTRLDAEYNYEEEDWKYNYSILDKIDSLSLINGKEEIIFKGVVVFVHIFTITPIE